MIAAILQVIYGAVQLSDITSLPKGRPYGSFQQINVYASFLATGMLCALWLFTIRHRKLAVNASAIALIIIPAMLVLVQSRTGYLGAIIGSIIMLLALRQRRCLALILMMTGTVAGLCLLYLGPKYFPGMIPTLVQSEGSTVQRWYMLHLTWRLICEHPIVGNGYGSFEVLLGQLSQQIPPGIESTTIQYPHNEFLYTWMEGGIVAVAGLLLMVVGVFIRLWSKGGRRWTGLALLLPIAIHMNLEYPLYQSVTHGITLVMLLMITGPAACALPTAKPSKKSLRIGVGLLASAVLVFMLSGVVSEVQLTRIEQQGLMPLVQDDNLSLLNPWSQHDRLDFDRHVALLLKFNLTQNAELLAQYRSWAEKYIRTHNNPDVYNSLMMIYRVSGGASAQNICLKAKSMWPKDLRFSCLENDSW
ncbi:PglL family O-oligosaccharyltransferase [Lelliottia wanjuensis]|uniref:PglL family O-oligosaccharyltransferase n=1 Tax=Lelliottia wanjuensis TaxID=3050585 RepID=UPI0025507697|nr:O-antigen ligase family protein [Lelliottia sp. V89_5]